MLFGVPHDDMTRVSGSAIPSAMTSKELATATGCTVRSCFVPIAARAVARSFVAESVAVGFVVGSVVVRRLVAGPRFMGSFSGAVAAAAVIVTTAPAHSATRGD